jgi:putative Mg2+ transporter-C (MgtC) family protein
MDSADLDIALRLGAALLAGAAIGLERSSHGRPAGFRTHALVALASALLMVVPMFGERWFPATLTRSQLTVDPTRMAQGIMTGIGFLGAGAILRDGLSVRGLTTAASIWITAAIGILMGVGFYFPGALTTVLTLGILTVFRRIEGRVPSRFEANLMIRFEPAGTLPEAALRDLLAREGFALANPDYRLDNGDGYFEYRAVIKADRGSRAAGLNEALRRLEHVRAFSLTAID